ICIHGSSWRWLVGICLLSSKCSSSSAGGHPSSLQSDVYFQWIYPDVRRQVIERLKQISHMVSTADAGDAPDDLSTSAKLDLWNEEGQRIILRLLKHDPILAVFGLRHKYLCSLLKRLLVEVEARGLPVADELADAYGDTLARPCDQMATSAAMVGLAKPAGSSAPLTRLIIPISSNPPITLLYVLY
ncbi:hypothetical protein Vretimale_14294, partial [Volvox reticuliferus]